MQNKTKCGMCGHSVDNELEALYMHVYKEHYLPTNKYLTEINSAIKSLRVE